MLMIKNMAMVHLLGVMVENTQDNGLIVNNVVEELL